MKEKSKSIAVLDREGGLSQSEFLELTNRNNLFTNVSISCLQAVRELQFSGRFDEAQVIIEKVVEDTNSQSEKLVGYILLAELLNKWGSCMPSYTIDVMERASLFADRAVVLCEDMISSHAASEFNDINEILCSSLYWKALNLASVGRLGGCETWSTKLAFDEADKAFSYMSSIWKSSRDNDLRHIQGSMSFVKGIISFCRAIALEKGYLQSSECEGRNTNELKAESLAQFKSAYDSFFSVYGSLHNQTVKAITMICVCCKMCGDRDEALHWSEEEVKARIKLHGEWHPRTKLAKETLQELKGGKEEEEPEQEDVQEISPLDFPPERMTLEIDPFELKDVETLRSAMRMFADLGVVERFNIPKHNLARFVLSVKNSYFDVNPFHNWRHAWSVSLASFIIMTQTSASRLLTPVEKIATLITCLCHDLFHPGVNSDFLIKSAAPMALEFPAPNVLEHMHWNATKKLLQSGSDCDILINANEDEKQKVLDLVHEGIMATDMHTHHRVVDGLTKRIQTAQSKTTNVASPAEAAYDAEEEEDRRELMRVIVHASDLSGQSLPREVAYTFGRGVLEEFHNQSMRERMESLPQTAFMQGLHDPLAQAKAQLGFLHYVLQPLWQKLSTLLPELEAQYLRVVERLDEIDFDNLESWQGRHDGLKG